MLNVEDWAEIRRLYRTERMPIKAVARVMGCSKNTVRSAIRALTDKVLLVGSPAQVVERLGEYADAGVQSIVLSVAAPAQDRRRVLDTLSEHVLDCARRLWARPGQRTLGRDQVMVDTATERGLGPIRDQELLDRDASQTVQARDFWAVRNPHERQQLVSRTPQRVAVDTGAGLL